MNTYEAIKRIAWRMNVGHWKGNDKDAEAINTLIDFFEKTKQNWVEENHLFAKLYIWMYQHFLQKYDTHVFDEIPQKELSRILEHPLERFYESMTRTLNESEKYALIAQKRDLNKHPANYSNDFTTEELKVIAEDVFTQEEVTANLNTMITQALNNYQR